MKIVTIFGAGASHDSLANRGVVHSAVLKPPLTNELFQDSGRGGVRDDFLSRYPSLATLVPDIRKEFSKGNVTLEQVLGQLWLHAQDKPHRLKQIGEASRYIAQYLWQCSKNYILFGSNYEAYINLLLDYKLEGSIVTFNYDTLIESAWEKALGLEFKHIEDYISCPLPLIKVHGSWNWYKKNEGLISIEDRNRVPFDEDVCIGLPIVEAKTIVCPTRHMDVLREHIKEADKIIVIGWRGNEPHFFDELEKAGTKSRDLHLIVVNSSDQGCAEAYRNFQPHFRNVILERYTGGFTKFIDMEAKAVLSKLL